MAPSEMLRVHGTPDALPPSAIVAAAQSDLVLRERKREHSDDEALSRRHYAFHRRHVQKAVTAADLIAMAIDDPLIGLESGKYNTRLIYSREGRLRAALALAQALPEAA